MPITTIVLFAGLVALSINGLLFLHSLHRRVNLLNAPKKKESTSSLPVKLIKKVIGAAGLTLMSPLTGLCIMSATIRHHSVGGFLKAFLEDRKVSVEDERELVKWLNETHPLPEHN